MLLCRSSGSESSVVTTPVPSICYLGMYSGISGEDRAILMPLCRPWVKLRPNMGTQLQERLFNQNKHWGTRKKLAPRAVYRLCRDSIYSDFLHIIISSDFLHHTAIKQYWIGSILTMGARLGKGRRKESDLNLQRPSNGEVITALSKSS